MPATRSFKSSKAVAAEGSDSQRTEDVHCNTTRDASARVAAVEPVGVAKGAARAEHLLVLATTAALLTVGGVRRLRTRRQAQRPR